MNKQLIVDKLNQICKEKKPVSKNMFFHKYSQIWMKNGLTVFLNKHESKLLNEIVEEIITEPLFHRDFSITDIEDYLKGIIIDASKLKSRKIRQQRIGRQVNGLISGLKKKINIWHFVIPLENFKLSLRKLKINGVTLFKFTNYQARKYLEEYRNLLDKNKLYKNKDEEKKRYLEQYKKRIIEPLLKSTCAKVCGKGTLKGAQQVALKKVDEMLSLIKLYGYSSDASHRKYFGVKGEIIPCNKREILRKRQDKCSINPLVEFTGYLHPFKLNKSRLNFMKKNAFMKLVKIAGKQNKSNFDKKLLTAIYWYSKAYDIPEVKKTEKKYEPDMFNLGDKFLKLMVSMESLLIFGKESKTFNLKTRSSYILTNNKQRREQLKKYMQKAYDVRSKIVHEGQYMVSQSIVNGFMNYVQSVIIKVLKNKDIWRIKTNEDLYQWFEKNRLLDRL